MIQYSINKSKQLTVQYIDSFKFNHEKYPPLKKYLRKSIDYSGVSTGKPSYFTSLPPL